MAQVILSASAAQIIAQPVGKNGGHDTMTSVEFWTSSADVYVEVKSSDVLALTPRTGYLLEANTNLHITLKPYEALYGFSSGGATVYVLEYVSDHARAS